MPSVPLSLQISGQYEQIYVYSKIQRDAALTDAQEKPSNKLNLRVQSLAQSS